MLLLKFMSDIAVDFIENLTNSNSIFSLEIQIIFWFCQKFKKTNIDHYDMKTSIYTSIDPRQSKDKHLHI